MLKNWHQVEVLTSEDLLKDEVIRRVIELSLDSYHTHEPDEIRAALRNLSVIFLRVQQQGGQSRFNQQLQQLNSLLNFGLLQEKDSEEIRKLFDAHLIYLLSEEPDFKQRLVNVIFIWGDYDGKRRSELLEAVSKSASPLGGTPTSVWLRDYDSFMPASSRSSLMRVNYMNQAKLVKELNSEEREILIHLFETYDWLREGAVLPVELIDSERRIVGVRATPNKPFNVQALGGVSKSPSPIYPETVRTPVATSPETQLASKQVQSINQINITPQAFKQASSAFFFNMDDEKEVDKFRIKNQESGIVGTLEQQLRSLADEVINKYKFNFKDEAGKRRFVNLFMSALKGIRTKVDILEALKKGTEAGGLGLPADKAEIVLKILDQAKHEFETRGVKPAEPIAPFPAVVQPEPAILPPPPPKREVAAGVVMPKSDKIGGEPTGPMSQDQVKNWREEMLQEIAETTPPVKPAPTERVPGALDFVNVPLPPRPELRDIKVPPRVVGPLEELKSLSLVDFRRLDASPVEALNKIRAKIDLIGEASVTKRLEAIHAWQSSALYQLYLKLGRACIEQGQAIAQVVASMDSSNQPVLSEAEFEAIADFNSKIRF